MKNKTIISIIALSAVVLLTTSAVVFAQQLNAPNVGGEQGTVCTQDAKLCPDGSYVSRTGPNCEFAPCPVSNQVVNPTVVQPPITSAPTITDKTVIFEPASGASGGASPTTLHIPTTAVVPAPVQSAINSLEVKPTQVFSSDFSQVTNLVVNPIIEDKKVIYKLEVPTNTQIYKANELAPQPILDLEVSKPVEFKLSDNKVIINNEQIVDYKSIVGANELMPLVELKVNSAISDGQVRNLEVVPSPESTEFKFIYKDKEVMMPIYSDFKVENQKISLLEDGQVHDLKVLPSEMYTGIFSALEAGESGKNVEVKDLSVKVENQKAIYDLKVKEPFKLFWVIPMKINSQYIIDSENGEIIKSKSSWFSIFGKNVGLRDLLAVRNQLGDTIKRWKVELYAE